MEIKFVCAISKLDKKLKGYNYNLCLLLLYLPVCLCLLPPFHSNSVEVSLPLVKNSDSPITFLITPRTLEVANTELNSILSVPRVCLIKASDSLSS